MVDEFLNAALSDLIGEPVSGFWGRDAAGVDACVPVRVVRNGDIAEDRTIDTRTLPIRWFTHREYERARVSSDDTLVVSSGYVGKSGALGRTSDGLSVAASNFVRIVRPKRGIDPRWLYWVLGGRSARREMLRHSGGTTISNLSSTFFRSFVVPYVPGLEEQVGISAVLDTVEEAILKTEQLVAKLEQEKQGLLHDLLTRGIDDNGELRDPEQNPEQFDSSPLGRLPKEWKVLRIAELMQPGRSVTYGIVQPGAFTTGGILLIRGQDYINGWQPLGTFFRVALPLHRQYARSTTVPDDVLLTIVGATTGATAIVPGWVEEANITQTTARLAFDRRFMLPRFGRAVLDSELGQGQVRRYVKGSAQPGLNLGDVDVFLVPVPPLSEQQTITAVLLSASEQIEAEMRQLEKLRLLKQGLSEDLLTGRVRVTKLLEGNVA